MRAPANGPCAGTRSEASASAFMTRLVIETSWRRAPGQKGPRPFQILPQHLVAAHQVLHRLGRPDRRDRGRTERREGGIYVIQFMDDIAPVRLVFLVTDAEIEGGQSPFATFLDMPEQERPTGTVRDQFVTCVGGEV